MFKSAIAIVILVLLILSNFSRLFIYAGFELNQKYIASTLCENRDKPEIHCNGKCYLMKKLKQAEEKEKKQEQDSYRKGSVDQCILKQSITPVLFSNQIKEIHLLEITFHLPKFSLEVPHPPPSIFNPIS
ncbi:hypothetical protein [Pedobacter cryoconitis]|nr:hypothetical protein [Pedobacter cryoconitis]